MRILSIKIRNLRIIVTIVNFIRLSTYLVESVWFCVHTNNIYFVSNSCGWNSSSKLTWICQLDMGYIYAYEEKDIRFICNNQQQCVIGQCHGNYGRLTDWKLFLF